MVNAISRRRKSGLDSDPISELVKASKCIIKMHN